MAKTIPMYNSSCDYALKLSIIKIDIPKLIHVLKLGSQTYILVEIVTIV